ncbi:MAG: hypothetical protein AAF366_18175 [Pseudomonadota bacterium]
MAPKKRQLVNPSEQRKEKAEERREVMANVCVKCQSGRYVLKKVGTIFKKDAVVCDKCGARKDDGDVSAYSVLKPPVA